MPSVNSTMSKRIKQLTLIGTVLTSVVNAQNTNSPYSRYGLGDLLPQQNILSRAMGGVATAYADFQSVNFLNPASYGLLQSVTYDLGLEVDNLSILSRNPVQKFSSASPIISYVNLGIPLKKGGGWGWVIGLRPSTRIKYKILRNERIITENTDENISTLFEGNGGSQQFYTGTGFRIKNFSAGINAGYLFGNKEFTSRRFFNNDTVRYYRSNYQSNSNFSGLVFNGGVQYGVKLGKEMNMRIGVQGSWKRELKATRDVIIETFNYDANGGVLPIDSVYYKKGETGNIVVPSSYSAGILFDRSGKWQLGIDYSTSKWSQYSYFKEPDLVKDNWQLALGGQLIPSGGKGYWSNVAYRGGFSYGKDYINAGGDLSKWTFSMGAGLPMRRVNYTNQFSIINVTMELGQRGNASSIVKENFFRLAVGFSMSDIWFIKRKYD